MKKNKSKKTVVTAMETFNNALSEQQITSYQNSGYSSSEAFSAALRENQRAEERANKRYQ